MRDEYGMDANSHLSSNVIYPEQLGHPHGFNGDGYSSRYESMSNLPAEPTSNPGPRTSSNAGPDLVKSPSHYNRNGVETWDVIEHVIAEYKDPTCAYHVASIHKYCDRAPYKGNFYQDIRKAIQHAKRLEKYLDRVGK